MRYAFVNLGSDHPSIMEAMVKAQRERPCDFIKFITCPSEMVALSIADGYARVTGQPQAVITHVDVGTQALGCAIHNASIGRVPVLPLLASHRARWKGNTKEAGTSSSIGYKMFQIRGPSLLNIVDTLGKFGDQRTSNRLSTEP